MSIPQEAFNEIIKEIERRPIGINYYRLKSGLGRSQVFGIVNRRSLAPDYSRNCWQRPKLYYHLLEFGKKYVTIPWNSITVNENYKADKHYDKNNKGDSFLVGFGDYEKGNLIIHEGDLSGNHDIKYNPIITDFSKVLHSVEDFEGNRYSLVYYFYERKDRKNMELPEPSVEIIDNEYIFYRGDEPISKKEGIPHNLKGKKKKVEDVPSLKDINKLIKEVSYELNEVSKAFNNLLKDLE